MKLILLTIIFPLLLISCFAQEKELKGFSIANLGLTITDVTKRADALELEVTLKNKSSESVLTVLPKLDDSIKTNYFLTFNEDRKVLQVRRHLSLYPDYVLGMPEPCYSLKIIKEGQTYSETFSLGYPMAITSYVDVMKADIRRFSNFNAQIGVLPFDDSIYQILARRPFGHCVTPLDKIEGGNYSGQTLLEVQKILSSDSK